MFHIDKNKNSREEYINNLRKERKARQNEIKQRLAIKRIIKCYKSYIIKKNWLIKRKLDWDNNLKIYKKNIKLLNKDNFHEIISDLLYWFNIKYDISRLIQLCAFLLIHMTQLKISPNNNWFGIISKKNVNINDWLSKIIRLIDISLKVVHTKTQETKINIQLLNFVMILVCPQKWHIKAESKYINILNEKFTHNLSTIGQLLRIYNDDQPQICKLLLVIAQRIGFEHAQEKWIKYILSVPNIKFQLSNCSEIINIISKNNNKLLDNNGIIINNIMNVVNTNLYLYQWDVNQVSIYIDIILNALKIYNHKINENDIWSKFFRMNHIGILVWRCIIINGCKDWSKLHILPNNISSLTPQQYTFRPADNSDIELRMQDIFAQFNYKHPAYLTQLCRLILLSIEKCKQGSILGKLSFNTPLLSLLWKWIRSNLRDNSLSWSIWENAILENTNGLHDVCLLFCRAYLQVLFVLEDNEFKESKLPFHKIDDLIAFITFLKMFVFNRLVEQARSLVPISISPIFTACLKLLTELYRRDERIGFAPKEHWLVTQDECKWFINSWQYNNNEQTGPRIDTKEKSLIMKYIPFIVPFKLRVQLLRQLIQEERIIYENPDVPPIQLSIRRAHVIQDGFDAIMKLGSAIKGRLKVEFLNEHGEAERGIDLGGPFKEFLETLSRDIFRPEYGLFINNINGEFFPNPMVSHIPDYYSTMEFIGRIVGKALLEGILVDVPFASFFLCKVLKQATFLSHLKSLDPQLYKNLLFLKHYDGDVRDLCLDFTITENEFDETRIIPLKNNGANIEVTNENRISYIYLVADYHLNAKIRHQTEAFRRGLYEIIKYEWLSMFNINELRLVLSGTPGQIDVEDWKTYTKYDHCSKSDRIIKWFWKIVERMNSDERQQLLRFATSCSRPPLMGFRYMSPPFTIRLIDIHDRSGSFFKRLIGMNEKSKAALPTSATCFNLLKIPTYNSYSSLQDKLKVAIQHHTGFHLT